METVVLENSSLPEGAPSFTSREIPCQVVESDGLKMRKGKVYAKKANASFVVEFKGDENCETALVAEKLKYLGRAPLKCSAVEIRDRAENSVWVLAEGDSEVNKTELFLPSMKYNFHSSRENFVLNTGYHEKPVRRIRMTFEQKGYYDISGMKVYCQKTDTLNDWANRRKTEAPQDLEISGNHISCSVDFSKDRALVFSVPYSKGWSLFVDGEEAQVKKANHIFLAAELPAGKHEVMLSYETPYLWAGILVCGLGVWLLIEILEKFKNENNTMFLIFV